MILFFLRDSGLVPELDWNASTEGGFLIQNYSMPAGQYQTLLFSEVRGFLEKYLGPGPALLVPAGFLREGTPFTASRTPSLVFNGGARHPVATRPRQTGSLPS